MSQLRLLLNYTAESDPYFARNICMKYGYTVPPVRNARELGGLLEELIQLQGEPAFIEILDHHPDKALILESYQDAPATAGHIGADGSVSKSGGCGCKGCEEKKQLNYLNADAAGTVAAQINSANTTQHNANQITSTQTGVIILACAMIISLAIMSKK